jgi:ABC-2 type transport system permease protein
MSDEFSAAPGSFESHATTPGARATICPFYWSIRRELWENRSIYIAPLVVAGLFLAGFIINLTSMRHKLQGRPIDAMQLGFVFMSRYEIAAALIMGTALIVGVFYTLEALYGERRDRSILFWKSLPVSDTTVVLSKVVIPLIVLPLVSFVITIATQFVMLLVGSVILAGSGTSIAPLWTQASFFRFSGMLLYHFFTVHGLWYAPLYGWLLLVSAWAPRAPFLWAFLPPFVVCGLEKIAFNTFHFLDLLKYRLSGPPSTAMGTNAQIDISVDMSARLMPHHFFSEPGLWTGLAVAAVFLIITVRVRRRQGPI